tara:strand:+ start:1031 stop:1555 length:525 start_codon:yes stop_codon:yes gene_type:complete
MKDKLKYIRKGGRVERFHAIPVTGTKQNVAAHSWGVTALLIELFPEDAKNPELIKACLYHDMAECVVGDVPAPTKWRFDSLAKLHGEAENQVLKECKFEWILSYREACLLKIVDMLELLFYSVEQKQMGNTYFNKVFSNAVDYLSTRIYNTEQLEPTEVDMLRDILKEMTEKCG